MKPIFAAPAKPRRTQVRVMYAGLLLVAMFFAYAMFAAVWVHFELWNATP